MKEHSTTGRYVQLSHDTSLAIRFSAFIAIDRFPWYVAQAVDIPGPDKLIPTYVRPITMVDTIVIEDVGIDLSMQICRSFLQDFVIVSCLFADSFI